MDILELIGRKNNLFDLDMFEYELELNNIITKNSFLVIGGAGTIGQAVVKLIFSRNPKLLHVVDISENNLVELVRQIRSSFGYINGEFKTYCLDIGSLEYDSLINSFGKYDYVFNLSALKHVRSEKDPFTLMRMIMVNNLYSEKTIIHSIDNNTKKYFSVSTDKAAKPVNMMGATKKIMEAIMLNHSSKISISSARFANVAFSDGSLLYGFDRRMALFQPLSVPSDIKRYFITPSESGQLCVMSALLGENRDVFFPKLVNGFQLNSLKEIAINYLNIKGYKPIICETEDEARKKTMEIGNRGGWPCYFFKSDTTGEKKFEEFYSDNETTDFTSYKGIGIIKSDVNSINVDLVKYKKDIQKILSKGIWEIDELLDLFNKIIPDFNHIQKDRHLDNHL